MRDFCSSVSYFKELELVDIAVVDDVALDRRHVLVRIALYASHAASKTEQGIRRCLG